MAVLWRFLEVSPPFKQGPPASRALRSEIHPDQERERDRERARERERERERERSGSCRCAIIVVPWHLRMLSLLSTCLSISLTDKSPRAKRAETDPRHGTPTMAHLQPPEWRFGRFRARRRAHMAGFTR